MTVSVTASPAPQTGRYRWANVALIFAACTVTYFVAIFAIHLLSPKLARVETI